MGKQNSDYYWAGYHAYDGNPPNCPYESGTHARKEWLWGWSQADHDAKRASGFANKSSRPQISIKR